MKLAAIRFCLLLIILASVAIRHHTVQSRDQTIAGFDARAIISGLVLANSMTLRENPVKPPRVLSSIVYFQRQGCADESIAMPFSLNMEALPLLDRVLVKTDYRRRYIYLDQTWHQQNRMQMYLLWMKHAVLALASTSPFVPTKLAVVVADPIGCDTADPIDWRLVWDLKHQRSLAETQKTTELGRVQVVDRIQ
jgi:hypothetical protein